MTWGRFWIPLWLPGKKGGTGEDFFSWVLCVKNKINTHSVKDFWEKKRDPWKQKLTVTVSMDFPSSIFSRNR